MKEHICFFNEFLFRGCIIGIGVKERVNELRVMVYIHRNEKDLSWNGCEDRLKFCIKNSKYVNQVRQNIKRKKFKKYIS